MFWSTFLIRPSKKYVIHINNYNNTIGLVRRALRFQIKLM